MKATGEVRRVDQLGRSVIPIEIRRNLEINIGDLVEFLVDDDLIIMRKYKPPCIFCDSIKDVIVYRNKEICKGCITELKEFINEDA